MLAGSAPGCICSGALYITQANARSHMIISWLEDLLPGRWQLVLIGLCSSFLGKEPRFKFNEHISDSAGETENGEIFSCLSFFAFFSRNC